ncbi:serine/threonine-protein kinase [Streptomyces sp. JNUCC 64]
MARGPDGTDHTDGTDGDDGAGRAHGTGADGPGNGGDGAGGGRIPPVEVVGGRYRLLSPLGEGDTGTVWLARDEALRRDVAVKEVRAPAGLGVTATARLYARVERGARAAARITHRGVVSVHDVALEGGRPWIVMELVRGLSLADELGAEGPLPARRAARIGAEVLGALRAAHGVGVLHRDVRPGNVLLANDGRVTLSNVGIATTAGGTSALTRAGEITGSPEYLAPERALGGRAAPESDLWSLGVLLYVAVEGRSPFRRGTPADTLRAVVDEEPPAPLSAGPLAPVIEGLLRKDPAARMTADQAQRALRLVAAGGGPVGGTGASGASSAAGASGTSPGPDGTGGTGGPGGAGREGAGGNGPAPVVPDPDTGATASGRRRGCGALVLTLVTTVVLVLVAGALAVAAAR